jgi:hypothetical protein
MRKVVVNGGVVSDEVVSDGVVSDGVVGEDFALLKKLVHHTFGHFRNLQRFRFSLA